MIRARELTKRFGRLAAVDGLSFGIDAGEAVALWGANGAGKTTVLRCVLGLARFKGTVEVAGFDVRRDGKSVRAAAGYVPQELALPADLPALEALRFFARLKRAPAGRAAEVLADVGLDAKRTARIGTLSGGMKQRLALAVALLNDPPILVLDEPTANLDLAAQSAMLGRLESLRARGKTILFASHHQEEIEALADRVLVLESGRLKLACRPGELADAVGLRCVLTVRVEEGALERAVRALERRDYRVRRNGHGLFVDVAAGAKSAPIEVLLKERIAVRDFEIGAATHTGEAGR